MGGKDLTGGVFQNGKVYFVLCPSLCSLGGHY